MLTTTIQYHWKSKSVNSTELLHIIYMQKLSNCNITIQRGSIQRQTSKAVKTFEVCLWMLPRCERWHTRKLHLPVVRIGPQLPRTVEEWTYLLTFLLAPLHLHACGRPLWLTVPDLYSLTLPYINCSSSLIHTRLKTSLFHKNPFHRRLLYPADCLSRTLFEPVVLVNVGPLFLISLFLVFGYTRQTKLVFCQLLSASEYFLSFRPTSFDILKQQTTTSSNNGSCHRLMQLQPIDQSTSVKRHKSRANRRRVSGHRKLWQKVPSVKHVWKRSQSWLIDNYMAVSSTLKASWDGMILPTS